MNLVKKTLTTTNREGWLRQLKATGASPREMLLGMLICIGPDLIKAALIAGALVSAYLGGWKL
jgi:hypothetical protein